MMKKIRAFTFFECSAKENDKIDEVIHAAVRAANGTLNKKVEEDDRCLCCSWFFK